MTGGQVLIDFNKVSIGSTATELKTGTFEKIERAIALQKQIVIINCVFAGTRTLSASVIPVEASTITLTGEKIIVFRFTSYSTGGSEQTFNIVVTLATSGKTYAQYELLT